MIRREFDIDIARLHAPFDAYGNRSSPSRVMEMEVKRRCGNLIVRDVRAVDDIANRLIRVTVTCEHPKKLSHSLLVARRMKKIIEEKS